MILKAFKIFLFLTLASSLNAQFYFHHCDEKLSKSNFIYDIKKAENGYIYIANDRGLLASDGSKSWYVYNEDNNFPREIIIENGLFIRLSSGDTASINTIDATAYQSKFLNESKAKIDFSKTSITIENSGKNFNVNANNFENFTDYAIDKNKNIWISSDKNLYLNELSSNNLTEIKISDNHQKVGINSVEIIGSHLWIGTNGFGLYYLDLENYFYQIPNTLDYSPCTMVNNSLCTFDNNGVTLFSLNKNDASKESFFKSPEVLNVKNIDGQIHIIRQQSLIIISSEAEVLKEVKFKNFRANGTFAKFNNNIYLGSNADGVLEISKNSKQKQINTTNGLLHNQVLGFANSSSRILSYSSKGGISDVIDNNEYIDYQNNFLQGNIKDVSFINNEWWVSTEGFGIRIFDENLKFKGVIDQTSLLKSPYVLSATPFGNKTIGIQPRDFFIIDNEQSTFVSPSLFVPNVIFNGEYCVVNNENIILKSNNGLINYFNAEKLSKDIIDIKITKTELNGYSIDEDPPYGTSNNINVIFEAIIPSPIFRDFELYYTLEGRESRNEKISTKDIEIKNLSYGSYNLKIFNANGDLLCSNDFVIEKAFYLKPFFWIIILVGAVLLIILIVNIRTASVKKQNEILEEKIKKRTKEIQKKSKLLEQISFTLSHDLKTPAHNVIELAKMLKSRLPESIKYAKMFEDAGGQILLKTLDTLEILRSDSAFEAEKELIDVKELFEIAIKPLHFQIEKTNADIEIVCPKTIEIILNRSQWQSVFFNIVSNSLKYAKKDTAPQIIITISENEESFIISIKDNGIGIDTNKLKVFERFNSGENNATSTGVGLSLVKQIVESHDGVITLESEIGKGTEFTIRLPR